MGATSIEWTDHSINPIRARNKATGKVGHFCEKISPGCANCYAEKLSKRNPKVLGEWGPNGKRVIAAESYWKLPYRWDREAEAAGERRQVFCASLADVFEEREELVEHRTRLFKLIAQTPNLDWLLLTKRPQVALGHWPLWAGIWCSVYAGQGQHDVVATVARDYVIPNVWLGVSVEDQQRADERIPVLLQTRAAVRFLSCEPLLGPVDLSRWMSGLDVSRDENGNDLGSASGGSDIDWVIIGGESGHDARPCHVAWVRSLVRQCREAGVACFVKQLGSNPREEIKTGPIDSSARTERSRISLKIGETSFHRENWLHDHKGGNPAEWPEDLRIREFPAGRTM